ncbi:hypothetical protein [Tenacibaculum agarivorans]|uniref:hypothetical protein n=1 Tax=Tenacibaculum agarivorans TaxID=1908389 RepID=UPI00094B8846|nr:hypothetical protein [Tenacibaculum agarivorans]
MKNQKLKINFFLITLFLLSVLYSCSKNEESDTLNSVEIENGSESQDQSKLFPHERTIKGSRILEPDLKNAEENFEKKYNNYLKVDYYLIDKPGIYEGFYFKNYITIESDNVTLVDCIINGHVSIKNKAKNVRIEYSEVRGEDTETGKPHPGIGVNATRAGSNIVIYKSYIHSFFDLLRCGPHGIEVTESYLYDWGKDDDGNHADAFQYPSWDDELALTDKTKIIFSGNSIIEPFIGQKTAAIGFNSVTKHWTITNNYFKGAGYTMYISGGGYILKDNVFAGDNTWGNFRYYKDGRDYGVWKNNIDLDGNEIKPPTN